MAQATILVDADACPVKDEIYRVAERHGVPVTLVANSGMRVPRDQDVRLEITSRGFDAADDRIAELSGPHTLVITADILLAQRCLETGAVVVSPTGKPFTADNIGSAVATRAIMADMRAGIGNEGVGGPAPFSKADRSRFLQAMESLVRRLKSGAGS